jgi:hypothetical protein
MTLGPWGRAHVRPWDVTRWASLFCHRFRPLLVSAHWGAIPPSRLKRHSLGSLSANHNSGRDLSGVLSQRSLARTTANTRALPVHDNGDGGMLEYMARNAAQEQLAKPRMRIGAHYEEITGKFTGSSQ